MHRQCCGLLHVVVFVGEEWVEEVLPDSAMRRETMLMFSSGTSWSSRTRIAIMAAAPVATVASWEERAGDMALIRIKAYHQDHLVIFDVFW